MNSTDPGRVDVIALEPCDDALRIVESIHWAERAFVEACRQQHGAHHPTEPAAIAEMRRQREEFRARAGLSPR